MAKLAIVIPAYKINFFNQSLLSIVNQTNKDFAVYIGDDCSPDNLYNIVKKYEDRISISYKYFDENLGNYNLVAHWERCIDMVGEEEWIWLFSDDDMMDSTCVESFFNSLTDYPGYDLYRFDLYQIDEYNNISKERSIYPNVLSSEEFLIRRLKGKFPSFVVEYIFKKSHFLNNNRFQSFDLAWGSDDATWIKLSGKKGIRRINQSCVYWRYSKFNISSDFCDSYTIIRKLNARIAYAEWLIEYVNKNKTILDVNSLKQELKLWLQIIIERRIDLITFKEGMVVLSNFYRIIINKPIPKHLVLRLYIYRNYLIIKKILFNQLFHNSH